MMSLAEFHFLRPWWWLALVPLIAGLIWFARRPVGMRIWKKVVEPHLMPHVLIGSDARHKRWPLFAMTLAGLLAIAAAAGPAWDRLPQPVFRSDDALVITLDLSRSMDVADVSPSRLQRARFKINDVLNERPDGQTALIVYAAQAFTVSPLTDDSATIVSQLPVLTTDLPPAQGSRVDRALLLAKDLLQQSGSSRGQVLVVTDGANPETSLPAARELSAAGYGVSVLGVGTAEGGPIPGRGGLLKDRDGAIVVARLDTNDLEALAGAGGGQYFAPTTDDRDVNRFVSTIGSSASASETGIDSALGADVWRDQGYWLLLPLLPLAALAFRRGFLLSLSFLVILPFPRAEAFAWQDLWQRSDQQASEALAQGDAESAAALFENPAWRAAAEYRAGQFEESLSSLSGQSGVEALYNRGNALAQLGRFDDAIEAYQQAIEIEPDHEDAIYNRDLLLDMQQQQEQQQDQQQDGEQGDSEDQPQDGEQGDSQDQQQEEGEQGGSQDQQQEGEQGDSQSQQQEQLADGESGSSQDQQETGGQDEMPEETEALSDAEKQRQEQAEQQFRDQMREAEARAAEDAAEESDRDEGAESVVASQTDETVDEAQQAVEQWLRQVPDDPGGLLRRKFQRQHQLYQMERDQVEEIEQW